jgi:uncharacterized coiled-coil DUF342 family protein
MTRLIGLLSGWQVKLAIALVVLSSLYFWHLSEVKVAVNKVKQEYLLESALQYQEITKDAFWKTQELKDSFAKIDEDKDAKLQTLNSRVNTLTTRLRNRPSRSENRSSNTGNTGTKEAAKGSNGSELYREDAIFLIWEATRADTIKEELLTCYNKYDTAKDKIDKFKRDNTSSKP